MKNLITVLGAMALVVLIGCGKEQASIVPQKEKTDLATQVAQVRQDGPVTSIEEVEALHLQETYQLSDEVYHEFMGSLDFQEGKFRGCMYEDVEAELGDDESVMFWSHFGVVLLRHTTLGISYDQAALDSTHEGYKSHGPRDCKQRRKFICLLGTSSFSSDIM